ncbi:Predicted methyltransferase regulatory domain-containing protein [Duganella sp. CF517]|uniref:class I SAM-dependent methyltransferase n=1 Tax=Duganella sp. CF517 TaxID=1881038 RepID=UPI0008D5D790|nr:class I SAM-dependent methyltransferase [Duganella sp. CF517]SEN35282.1 Predicted methyltransferase regulatory domain-containing protein [Duganella sp. CF517]
MTDWTGGYVADVGYTYGYYGELNPLRARLALLSANLALPKSGAACELGFGQGISANVHAAGSGTRWYGTDFNPAQANFAGHLAESFSGGPQLFDQSFAEFCARDDLPDFDFIGLHGIWSWISDDNRAVIVDFLRRKLKVGGVLYISYNTQPGWAAMVPVRDLLNQHADMLAPAGAGVVARVEGALAFAKKLWAVNPAFARNNPQIAERLKKIEAMDRNYLAHEYFNRDWVPMSFADMAAALAPAKIDFACSATYLDHLPNLGMTQEQLALLDELPDPVFRQSTRDFMVGQQFRRDYWVKGARKLNPLEYREQLRAQRVVMVAPRDSVTMTVKGVLGEATLTDAIYRPILDLMSDHQVRGVGEIEHALREHAIPLASLHQALMVLTEKAALAPAHDEATIAAARPRTDQLNRLLLDRARGSGEINYLASPVLGGAVTLTRFPQLFILAIQAGKASPEEWAAYVLQIIKGQGQSIVKDGKPLQGDQANFDELLAQATEFGSQRLAGLRALGVL